jgi:hypothetical protein
LGLVFEERDSGFCDLPWGRGILGSMTLTGGEKGQEKPRETLLQGPSNVLQFKVLIMKGIILKVMMITAPTPTWLYLYSWHLKQAMYLIIHTHPYLITHTHI